MVVINTNAGNDKVPAWSLNLKADPEAEVEIGRQKRAVVARVAEGEERTGLWRRHNEQFAGFDEYEKKLEPPARGHRPRAIPRLTRRVRQRLTRPSAVRPGRRERRVLRTQATEDTA